MTVHFASRQQRTRPCDGTHSFLGCRRPPCWASEPAKRQRSVLCAERLTIPDPSVHFNACTLHHPGPLPPRPALPDAKLSMFVSRGTKAYASFRATANIDTYVPPATSHTKQRIAQRPLIARSTSNAMAPLHKLVHMPHSILHPMPAHDPLSRPCQE